MCLHCDWKDFADEIDLLIMDDDYEFASDTLENICEWVTENEHVTDEQRSAVGNIRDSVRERD